MLTLTRAPARISESGTFPLSGFQGASYTIGREAVLDAVSEIMRIPGMISCDIEGCGKDGRKRYDVKAVIIGDSNHAWIFDPRDTAQFHALRRIINEGDRKIVFHNSPFDVPILSIIGLMDLDTIWRVLDTLIWARLAEPDERARKTLTNAAATHLGIEISNPLPGMLKSLGISTATWYQDFDLDSPAYRIMAATDAILTHRLVSPVKDAAFRRLTEGHPFTRYGVTGSEALELVDREQIINRQHLRRTCRGYLVDPEYLDSYRDTTAAEQREIEKRLEDLGIRPGNAGDLTTYLDERGLLPDGYPRTPKTGKPSGAKGNLDLLTNDIARDFVVNKEVTHILRDYLDKTMDNADDEGRIHSGVNILGAATGRMSISGDAPLHQFSGPARGIILADDWEEARRHMNHPVLDENGDPHPCTCSNMKGMVSIDWSQIEPVVVANIAGDIKAVEYYEAGNKFYNALVEFGGIPYKAAKVTLLAQLYGEGIRKLAADLRVEPEEAESIRDMVWKTLPGSKRLAGKKGKLQTIAAQYKLIFTLSGRIVPVPAGWWPCWDANEPSHDIDRCRKCNNRGMIYSVAVHKGVNYFVQGSAYDLLAEAEVRIIKAGLGDAIYLPMHDELVVDAEAAHDIRRIMETPPERLCMLAKRTPKLRTDMAHLGERWAAA
jgi:DNA polymerase-1